MKKALIGAGGFAREVKAHMMRPNMTSFVDDEYYTPNSNNIKPLSEFDANEYSVLIAIGDPEARHNVVQKLPKNTTYFSYFDPSALILAPSTIKFGEGCFVAGGCILTDNIVIGDHAHLNLQTTIGHDCVIGDFFTTAPGAKISGNCTIHDMVYVGTNASIREKITIHSSSIIGLNSGVVKDIIESGVYVGTPAKKIK